VLKTHSPGFQYKFFGLVSKAYSHRLALKTVLKTLLDVPGDPASRFYLVTLHSVSLRGQTMPEFFTTREVADLFESQTWKVRRLFEDGTLAEPPRFGRNRMIPRRLLPSILEELKARGWIQVADEAAS